MMRNGGIGMIKAGDIVSRISYGHDILFKVVRMEMTGKRERRAVLKGIDLRIIADAPLEDLVKEDLDRARTYVKNSFSRGESCAIKIIEDRAPSMGRGLKKADPHEKAEIAGFHRTPKILHIDGDDEYLELCLENYEKVGLRAVGKVIPEARQPKVITKLLEEHNPDILVLTGHDNMVKNAVNYKDLNNYVNSAYFIEAVRNARHYEPNLDQLVIFAGACQSHFEGLVEAGANYASAPQRVFIHALDPLLIVEQIAFTPLDQVADTKSLILNTVTGIRGIGGIQTKGKLRTGIPKTKFPQ